MKKVFNQRFTKQLQDKYLQCQQFPRISNLKRCWSNFMSATKLFHWIPRYQCLPVLLRQYRNLSMRLVYVSPVKENHIAKTFFYRDVKRIC